MFSMPRDIKDFLSTLVRISNENNFQIYVVGGLVRDRILGINNNSLDIDLLINFDIEKFKAIFDSAFKTNLEIRKNFLTASFVTESGANIDFVQTRKESYEAPGALPKVSPAGFDEDLRRRDFTINTLRVLLKDFSNSTDSLIKSIVENKIALDDLKNKKIRVLHEKSFLDDPTRIFRAIKYKVKVNGSYEIETDKLIKTAIKENYLKHISNFRILQEFLKILLEEEYKKILSEIVSLELNLPYFGKNDIKAIKDSSGIFNSRLEVLKYLASILKEDQYLMFLNDLNVSKKERKELLS